MLTESNVDIIIFLNALFAAIAQIVVGHLGFSIECQFLTLVLLVPEVYFINYKTKIKEVDEKNKSDEELYRFGYAIHKKAYKLIYDNRVLLELIFYLNQDPNDGWIKYFQYRFDGLKLDFDYIDYRDSYKDEADFQKDIESLVTSIASNCYNFNELLKEYVSYINSIGGIGEDDQATPFAVREFLDDYEIYQTYLNNTLDESEKMMDIRDFKRLYNYIMPTLS